MQCYDEAGGAFGWKRRDPRPGSMRDGDWLIGWGCATAVYPTHVATATARVRLMPDGKVRVQSAAHEIGNGAYTVIGQMAAQRTRRPAVRDHRRARRFRSSAGDGRGRLQHDGQHLFGGDEGLRRDPREAGRAPRPRRMTARSPGATPVRSCSRMSR